jgi:3',5'-cyclic AMP phosphodiesterase CpdA
MSTKKSLLGAALLLSMTMGCAKASVADPYRLEMAYREGFSILWLNDIHWGWNEDNPDYQVEKSHLNGMISSAIAAHKPDLLVLTGDSFRTATTLQVNELLDLIDGYGLPWAFTYGNHDTESFSTYRYYINEQILKRKNPKFVDVKNDDLTGLTNYYIDLMKDDKVLYRLYIIDSNTYQDPNQEGSGYDVIHAEQLEHLKTINATRNDGAAGLAFFHIPLTEFTAAYQGYKMGLFPGQGDNGEAVCSPYKNNGAYEVFKSINVKACFCGHDHKNYSDIFYKNEMILSYGLKATDLDYHAENLFGYKIITLPENPAEFSLSSIASTFYLYQ